MNPIKEPKNNKQKSISPKRTSIHTSSETLITADILTQLRNASNPKPLPTRTMLISSPSDSEKLQSTYDTLNEDLLRISLTAPVRNLDRRTQRKIRRLVPERLISKYPDLFRNLMVDICEEYILNIKRIGAVQKIKTNFNLGLKSKVKDDTFDWRTLINSSADSQSTVRKHVKFYEKNLFLTNSLFRFIQSESAVLLSNTRLVDIGTYRKRDGISLPLLRACIKSDISANQKQSVAILNEKLVKKFTKASFLKQVDAKWWPRFVIAAKKFITVKVTTFLTESTNSVLEDFHNGLHPLIEFCLNGELDVSQDGDEFFKLVPEVKVVNEFYQEIISLLTSARIDLPKIMAILLLPSDFYKIKINAPKYYQFRIVREIKFILNRLFSKINTYLATVKTEYQFLFTENYRDKINKLQKQGNVEAIHKEIQFLNVYKNKIQQISTKLDFEIGCIDQENIRNCLLERTQYFLKTLFDTLVELNGKDLKNLHEELQLMEQKATQIPKDTAELIHLTQFMNEVKEERIDKFKKCVTLTFVRFLELLEVTEVSKSFIELNSVLMKSLESIPTLVDKNAGILDYRKNELEENLQKKFDDLNQSINDYLSNLPLLDLMSALPELDSYLTYLKPMILNVTDFECTLKSVNEEELLFKFPLSSIPELLELKETILKFVDLTWLCKQSVRFEATCMDGPFENLVYEKVQEETGRLISALNGFHKYYSETIRQQINDNFPRRFKGMVDDPDPYNHPAPLKLCNQSIKLLTEFTSKMRLVKCFCSPALRQRHWDEMSTHAGKDLTPDYGTSLRKISQNQFDADLIEKFEIVNTAAIKELELQDRLVKIIDEWKVVEFQVEKDTDFSGILKITNEKCILGVIDHQINELVNMNSSVFVIPIKHEVNDWVEKLLDFEKIVKNVASCQKLILKYQKLFLNPHLNLQIPKEAFRFKMIIKIYKNAIKSLENNQFVDSLAYFDDLELNLYKINELFGKIYVGWNDFIQKISDIFPRFYFFHEDDFIDLFSDKPSQEYDKYINKCFPGIHSLLWEEEFIVGVKSSQNEKFNLKQIIKLEKGNLAGVFKEIEQVMIQTLQILTKECYDNLKGLQKTGIEIDKFILWINSFPQQILLIVFNINFCGKVETSVKENKLKEVISAYKHDIYVLVNDLLRFTRFQNVEILLRTKIINLIIELLQIESYCDHLLKNKINNIDEFFWTSKIRYYLTSKNEVFVRFLKFSEQYHFEYLGNFDNLFMTSSFIELTIRQLLLTKRFGIYPMFDQKFIEFSVFDKFCQILGVGTIFQNCAENLSSEVYLRYLQGIVKNTNVIAYLRNIENLKGDTIAIFTKEMFQLKKTVSDKNLSNLFFVVSGNYNAVSFYENFKRSFHLIPYVEPDLLIFTKISLKSIGFNEIDSLVQKIKSLQTELRTFPAFKNFKISFVELKSILQNCAANVINEIQEDEEAVLCQAIENELFPKLQTNQAKIFNIILKTVFPLKKEKTISISCEVIDSMNSKDLIPNEYFMKKFNEINETINSKTITIIFGNSSCKTTLIKLCLEQLNLSYEIISNRLISQNTENSNKVYCILGEIIASSNCLIIDGGLADTKGMFDFENKKLYSTDGKVTVIPKTFKLINETDNLNDTSPGILANSKLIFVDSKLVSYQCILKSNLNKLEELIGEYSTIEYLEKLFSVFLLKIFEFIKVPNRLIIQINPLHLTQSILNLFRMYLKDMVDSDTAIEDKRKFFQYWMQALVIISITTSIFTIITNIKNLKEINEFVKEIWKNSNIEEKINLPSDGILSDFCYVFKQKGSWKNIADSSKPGKIEINSFYCNMVPDINLSKFGPIIEMHLKNNFPLILLGPSGVGKTTYIKNIYENKFKDTYNLINVSLTPNMNTRELQKIILKEIKIEAFNTKNLNRKNLIFVDNFFISEKSNDCLDLLREINDNQTWFNEIDQTKITLSNLTIFNSIQTDINDIKFINKKYLKYFNIYYLKEFNNDSLFKIFSSLLFKNLRKNNFPNDVTTPISALLQCGIDIYNKLKFEIPKNTTNNNFLLRFTIKDFNRIVSSISLVNKETFDSKSGFLNLGINEFSRIFLDKFNDVESLVIQKRYLLNIFNKHFESDLNFDDTTFDTNFLYGSMLSKQKVYEPIDFQKTCDYFTEQLQMYNSNKNIKLNIILFKEAILSLIKICRLFNLEKCEALLVGPVGTGKRSLCKLASYIYNSEIFPLKITPNYGNQHWREDIRTVLLNAGAKMTKTTLIIDDNMFTVDILVDLFCLVNSGTLQNLYETVEQKQIVLDSVKEVAQEGDRSLNLSSSEVMAYFQKKYLMNLRVFICLNSSKNLPLAEKNLIQEISEYCEVLQILKWSPNALEEIATHFVMDLPLNDDIQVENLSNSCSMMHQKCRLKAESINRPVYITSSSYRFYLTKFQSQMRKMTNEIKQQIKNYEDGLDKLKYAIEQININKGEISILEPQITKMTKKSDQMQIEIAEETAAIAQASQQIREEEKIANLQAAAAESLKQECEKDLALAIPILEDAIIALNTLKPTDITLVKSMKNPPDVIKLVMAAVCVMKEIKPDRLPDVATGRKIIDYWGPSKRLLGEMNFLQQLKDFDKDSISPQVMVKIREEYLPNKNFQPHIVAKASSAAEGLCKWVIAMDLYDKVAKEVAPKKAKLLIAESKYQKTMEELNAKRNLLLEIEKNLASLNKQFEDNNEDLVRMIGKINLLKDKLDKAQTLVENLKGEKMNWIESIERLSEINKFFTGNLLLFIGIISYFGAFLEQERNSLINEWKNILKINEIQFTEDYESIFYACNSSEYIKWSYMNEFNDHFTNQNIWIFEQSKRFCVLIDSHLQGNEFIKKTENDGILEFLIVKSCNPELLEIIKDCVGSGKRIFVENICSKIKSYLFPILKQESYTKNDSLQKMFLNVSGEEIEINSNFKLYFASNFTKPAFTSEIFHLTTVINFSLNQKKLLNDFLDIITIKEMPLHGNKFHINSRDIYELKNQLNSYKISILKNLNESDLNVLEDKTAIENFRKLKLNIELVEEKLAIAEKTHNELKENRLKYEEFAKYTLKLYENIFKFSQLNRFYECSLYYFKKILKSSMVKADRSKFFEKRLSNLKNQFTFDLYFYYVKSLEKYDVTLFTFIICLVLDGEDAEFINLVLSIMTDTIHVFTDLNGSPSSVEGISPKVSEKQNNVFIKSVVNSTDQYHHLSTDISEYQTNASINKNPLNDLSSEIIDLQSYNSVDPNLNPFEDLSIKVWNNLCFLKLQSEFDDFCNDFITNHDSWKSFLNDSTSDTSSFPSDWDQKFTENQKLVIILIFHKNRFISNAKRYIKTKLEDKFVNINNMNILDLYTQSNPVTPVIFTLHGLNPSIHLEELAKRMHLNSHFVMIPSITNVEEIKRLFLKKQSEECWLLIENCHTNSVWLKELEILIGNLTFDNTHDSFRIWITTNSTRKFPKTLIQNSIKVACYNRYE